MENYSRLKQMVLKNSKWNNPKEKLQSKTTAFTGSGLVINLNYLGIIHKTYLSDTYEKI